MWSTWKWASSPMSQMRPSPKNRFLSQFCLPFSFLSPLTFCYFILDSTLITPSVLSLFDLIFIKLDIFKIYRLSLFLNTINFDRFFNSRHFPKFTLIKGNNLLKNHILSCPRNWKMERNEKFLSFHVWEALWTNCE